MKTRILAAIVLGLSGLVAASTANATNHLQRAPVGQLQMQVNPGVLVPLSYSMSCVVQGTPVEFPSDVVLRNTGPYTIPAGKWVHWYLHSQANGWHNLSAPLAPNQHVFLSNVIPGGWPAGASCDVSVQ